MEDWQEETLRFFWKKMKIERCIIREYYGYDRTLLESATKYQTYAYPNGIFIHCKYWRSGKSYATVTFQIHKHAIEIIDRIIRNQNSSRKDFGQNLEFTIHVTSLGVLMDLLWDLYEIDYAQYVPVFPQESTLKCPECNALISYDTTTEALWIKCRNCGLEIFMGGKKYDDIGN